MVQYFHLTSIFTANLLTISVSLFLTSSLISAPALFLLFIPSYVLYLSLLYPWHVLSAVACFGLICCLLLSMLQEVFLRHTQLFVTTMELAAKKKCSGWGRCTKTLLFVFLMYSCFFSLCTRKKKTRYFLYNCPISLFFSVTARFFLSDLFALFLCSRMSTPSTTRRTTGSST